MHESPYLKKFRGLHSGKQVLGVLTLSPLLVFTRGGRWTHFLAYIENRRYKQDLDTMVFSCIFLTNFLLYDLPQKVKIRRQYISHEPREVSGANTKMPIDSTRLLIYAQEPHISQHHLRILPTGTNGRLAAAQTDICADFSGVGYTISFESY